MFFEFREILIYPAGCIVNAPTILSNGSIVIYVRLTTKLIRLMNALPLGVYNSYSFIIKPANGN